MNYERKECALRRAALLGLLLTGVFLLAQVAGSAQDGRSVEAARSGPIMAVLNEEERAWLRDHPVITMANDPGWPPVEFTDARGEHAGMSADYLRLIEQRLGVKFKRVPDLNWMELYARHQRRELDMATCVAVTPPRLEFWAFTKPYLTVPVVIATRTDMPYIADMKELVGKKVALPEGYAVDHWITADWPGINLVRVSNAQAGLTLLQQGEVFAFIDGLVIIGDYQAKLKVTNIKIAGQTPYAYPLCMAVRKDWAPLVGILNKAMDAISEPERAEIYRKWLPVRYEYGFDYALFWKVLAGFAVILAGLALWIRKLTREIKQRQRAKEALRESQEKYQHLIETTDTGYVILDPQGRVTDANQEYVRLTGRQRREDVLGHSVLEWTAPRDHARNEAGVRRCAEQGFVRNLEIGYVTPAGQVTPVEINATVLGHGPSLQILSLCRDITGRKQAEAALEASRRLLELALQGGRLGIWDWNPQTGAVAYSDLWGQMLEYRPDEIESTVHFFERHVHPDDLPAVMDRLTGHLEGRFPAYRSEHRLRTKSGQWIWVLDRGEVAERNQDGRAVRVTGVIADITERKQAEEALLHSEATYREIFNTINDAIWIHDIETFDFLDANNKVTEMFGYSIREALALSVGDISSEVPPFTQKTAAEFMKKAAAGEPQLFEWHARRKDGHLFWTEVSLKQGTIAGRKCLLAIERDITERKRAEEALRKSEERYRAFVANSNEGIWLYEPDQPISTTLPVEEQVEQILQRGYVAECNDAAARMYGLDRAEELIGMRLRETLIHDPRNIDFLRSFIQSGYRLVDAESLERDREGMAHHFSNSMIGVVEGGILVRAWGVQRDVTERKRAEDALREKTEELDRFFTTTLDLLCVADTDGFFLRLNPQWEAVLGYPLAELQGRRFLDLVHPEDLEATLQEVARLDAQQPVLNFVNRYRCKDGSYRWFEWRSSPQGKLIYAAARDITDRVRAEEALRESEARFAVFMENLPAGAFMKDGPGAVVYANRYLRDLFGWGDILGRATRDLLPAEMAEKMEAEDRAALAQGPLTVTEQVRDAANRERVFQTSKFPIARAGRGPLLGGITVDLTERIRAEEALRASLAEKVVLLKEVHHRVKNNLQVVSSLLNLQFRQVKNAELRSFLKDTQNRISSMAILHEILYRSDNFAKIDFPQYVKSVCTHLAHSYGSKAKSIRLKQEIADVILNLDQAITTGLIINELVTNALKHAFPSRSGGEILVELQPAGEGHLVLRVSDNGVGFPADRSPQSTETLGLLLVSNLSRQLDGQLSVPGDRGTVFQIIFPVHSI